MIQCVNYCALSKEKEDFSFVLCYKVTSTITILSYSQLPKKSMLSLMLYRNRYYCSTDGRY